MRLAAGAAALVLLALSAAGADPEFVAPPANLVAEGLPPIPAQTLNRIAPYGAFRPSALLSWHPTRREMLVRQRLDNTIQVHRVAEPGARPEPLTDFRDAVTNAAFEPVTGEHFIFSRGEGGNEVLRRYRFDFATKAVTPLTPEGERAAGFAWSPGGESIAFTTQRTDRNNPDRTARTTLHVMDPRDPGSGRVVATFESGGWTSWAFSPDGRQLAGIEYLSANESHVWIVDVATGKRRALTRPAKGAPVSYLSPRWSKSGKGLYVLSDRGSEFRHIAHLTVATGREQVIAAHKHNVDEFAYSPEAQRIAYVTNEDGSHVLRFHDTAEGRELARPALVDGVISALEWRRGAPEVGFSVASARSAGDVFSYDVASNQLIRWTNGNNPEVNTARFSEPRKVAWKGYDGLALSGLHYHPPAAFAGKRPVIVYIHGGPESQARAGFIGRFNYYVNELGIAVIYPNVRGSAGFGKTFLTLDNGRRREDSVKDIGALIDWIQVQPELDGERILVMGGSYGGYMALACAVHFSDRIAGAVSTVGISNFVTFLERTESYRRDLRRAEYGDERDPAMRAFLERIAPVHNADRIRKPLFVLQGLNDPRVPYTESAQIVEALRKSGTPAWYLLARDEGHGFAKRDNADFAFAAQVEFVRRTVLREGP